MNVRAFDGNIKKNPQMFSWTIVSYLILDPNLSVNILAESLLILSLVHMCPKRRQCTLCQFLLYVDREFPDVFAINQDKNICISTITIARSIELQSVLKGFLDNKIHLIVGIKSNGF